MLSKIIMRTLAAVLVLVSAAFCQLPDAPTPQPKQAGFWTFRKFDGPPLRNPLKTKTFWIAEAGVWGTAIADAKLNNCKGNAPCGGEMYVDALVPAAVVTLEHWFCDRYMSRPLGLGPVGYLIFRHARGAATGNYP